MTKASKPDALRQAVLGAPKPRLLGLCASLRAGRWGEGMASLVEQIRGLGSEEDLKAFLKSESEAHLANFLAAGRAEGVPFDQQYRTVQKRFGKKGLCNSEVALAAAMWSASQLGCDIHALSLPDFFPATKDARRQDDLKAELLAADGFMLATPVYFGDRSSLAHDLIERIHLDEELSKSLQGRVYAGAAVGAKRNGGQETTLIYQIVDMVNAGLLAVGNDSETTSQYGGTVHAGDVGTAWKDEYGLWTTMGMGRRIARVAYLLSLAPLAELKGKLRVGFWLAQDCDGRARQQIDLLAEAFADQMTPQVLDATQEKFARCLACDICPTDIGVDAEYRCVVGSDTDTFRRVHKQFLELDAIVPIAYVPRDIAALRSTYQRFNERTRYLRRGDYVFTDFAVAPMVLEEVGANDSLWIRMLTSTLRHHTVMTRPIRALIHEGRILNDEQVRQWFGTFLHHARRLTVGRLLRSLVDERIAKYNPVGYVLSAVKDEEDQKLMKRKVMAEDRVFRLRKMAAERLQVP